MQLLEGVVQPYDWGSVTALPDLFGFEPTGSPQAEVWFGTHPRGPARLSADGRALDALIADDPVGQVGPERSELPFLVKLLAVAHNLSIQTHPDRTQAEAGFAAEQARGVPASERLFHDRNPKPELLCALTPFDALCGFREPDEAVAVLAGWELDELAPLVALLADDGSAATRLRAGLTWLLERPTDQAAALVDRVADRAGDELTTRLVERHPGDIGVVVAHLLNPITLRPGEALFLPAGNLHSYLHGVGVEVMANSDNVVRCGLTRKPVDPSTLLGLVDARPGRPPIQRPSQPVHRYQAATGDFTLVRIDRSSAAIELTGPAIAIVTDGRAELSAEGARVAATRGQAVWIPARSDQVDIGVDEGQVHLATTGDGAVR